MDMLTRWRNWASLSSKWMVMARRFCRRPTTTTPTDSLKIAVPLKIMSRLFASWVGDILTSTWNVSGFTGTQEVDTPPRERSLFTATSTRSPFLQMVRYRGGGDRVIGDDCMRRIPAALLSLLCLFCLISLGCRASIPSIPVRGNLAGQVIDTTTSGCLCQGI